MPLFFVAMFAFGLLVSPLPAHAGFLENVFKFFGGSSPAASAADAPADGLSLPLLGSQYATAAMAVPNTDGTTGDSMLQVTQDSALVSTHNPLGTISSTDAGQIVVYTVETGDTASSIASRFGISLNTLLWANNLRSAGAIKPGDQLVILPVTGVQYTVKKGDTLDSLAKKFQADAADIISFNGLAIGEPLAVGSEIIIPDGEVAPEVPQPSKTGGTPAPTRFSGLPDIRGYYMRPIEGGRNSRATRANPHGIHGYNGVDLANSCGTQVSASAAGTIIIARTEGWNGGYGKYIVMSHSNGTQTLYGHLSAILVIPGQTVPQGYPIGRVGSTGNSTGCHVHFEIRGAKNPF